MFSDALAAFRKQSWMKQGKVSSPERNLGYRWSRHFYLKLCDEFKKISPGETWDGVIALDEK